MFKFFSFLILLPLFEIQPPYDWVAFEMEKRVNKAGVTTKFSADVYFDRGGDMVTRFSFPTEIYVLNNKEGELSIYNAELNSVHQSVNYQAGSENTTFYYFLTNRTVDMGLGKIGFKLVGSKIDGNLLVNYWEPPQEINGLADVELVRDANKPIFIGYRNEKEEYVKKVFYYDYAHMKGLNFPQSITEIDYVEGDSIVSKTTFKDFRFDNPTDEPVLRFKIPEDATLEE